MSARTSLRSAAAGVTLFLMGARHPMHSTVAEVTHAAGSPAADITIRVFADDFGAVVSAPPGTARADSAMSRYVRGRFAVADGTARPAVLRWIGARREGDVILLRLAVPASGGLAGGRIWNGLLCDRFEDEINVVRATYGGRSATLLFTPGDHAKVLP